MSSLQQRLTYAMGEHIRPVDLARVCRISRAAVAKWFSDEKPVRELRAAHVFAVARLCHVDPEWLATGHGKPHRPHGAQENHLPPRRLALIQAYGTLPSELRRPIRMLIESLAAAHNERYAKWSREESERARERDQAPV